MAATGARDARVDRALQTLGGLLLTVCLALAGYGLKQAVTNSERITETNGTMATAIARSQALFLEAINKIDNRLSAIEANRFTVASGAELWREIASIRENLAKIPMENPPTWLKEQLSTLTKTAEAQAARLNEIERTLARLESSPR